MRRGVGSWGKAETKRIAVEADGGTFEASGIVWSASSSVWDGDMAVEA